MLPVSAAGALTIRLPLSEALAVHAEKSPLSKPSLKIKSAGAVTVRVGVKVGVRVDVEVAVDGMSEGVAVLVGVNVDELTGV